MMIDKRKHFLQIIICEQNPAESNNDKKNPWESEKAKICEKVTAGSAERKWGIPSPPIPGEDGRRAKEEEKEVKEDQQREI